MDFTLNKGITDGTACQTVSVPWNHSDVTASIRPELS